MSESQIWIDVLHVTQRRDALKKVLSLNTWAAPGKASKTQPRAPSWNKKDNERAASEGKHLFGTASCTCCAMHSLLSQSLSLKIFHCWWKAFLLLFLLVCCKLMKFHSFSFLLTPYWPLAHNKQKIAMPPSTFTLRTIRIWLFYLLTKEKQIRSPHIAQKWVQVLHPTGHFRV